MRVHRLVLLFVAVFGAFLFPATAAVAHPDPYPAPPVSLTANVGTIVVGGTVTITGDGFGGCDRVQIYVTYGPADAVSLAPASCGASAVQTHPGSGHTVTVDANGHFVTTVRLTTVGTATIIAIGAPSGFYASTTVQVTAALQQMANESDSGQSAGASVSAGAVLALTLPLLALALALVHRRSRAKTRA
jgi:hypothetical protein